MVDKKRVVALLVVLGVFAVVCVLFGEFSGEYHDNGQKREEIIFSEECKGKEFNFIDKLIGEK